MERGGVALGLVAEVEVLAHDEVAGLEPLEEVGLDKLVGGELAEVGRERDEGEVGNLCGGELVLFFDGGEQALKGSWRRENLAGMGFETEDAPWKLVLGGESFGLGEERLVACVEAVKIADGPDGFLRGSLWVGDEFHGDFV